METVTREFINHVGPVLKAGPACQAVVAAIEKLNASVVKIDRGSYVRVLVPWRCTVTADSIEQELGESFQLPDDLEKIMPSFKGKLCFDSGQATWSFTSDAAYNSEARQVNGNG